MSTLGLPSDECQLEYDERRLLVSIATSAQTIAQGGGGTVSLPWVSPKDFGAVGNGIADDTVPVQQAFDAIVAGPKITLVFDGMFAVSATITYFSSKTINIFGLGSDTGLKALGDFGDILQLRAPFSYPSDQNPDSPDLPPTESDGLLGIRLDNFSISSAVAMTSGYAIHTGWTDGAVISRLKLGSVSEQHWKLYGGMALEGQSNCDVSKCEVYSTQYGIMVNGYADPVSNIPLFQYDGQIHECVIWGAGIQDDPRSWVAGSYGIWISGGCGGFRLFGNGNVSGYQFGVYVSRIQDHNFSGSREIFIDDFYVDSNGDAGIVIDDAISLLTMNGAWSVANNQDPGHTHGYGIWVKQDCFFRIFGGIFTQNTGSDIVIDSSGVDLRSDGASTEKIVLTSAATVNINGGQCTSSLTIGTISALHISGVFGLGNVGTNEKRTSVAADYPATIFDRIIAVTSTASARTITIPDPTLVNATATNVFEMSVVDESGGAATHNITVSPAAGTINGAASKAITTNFGFLRFYSNGTAWFTT